MRPAHVLGLLVFALALFPAAASASGGWGPLVPHTEPLDILGLPTLEEMLAPELGLTLTAAIVADNGDGEVGPGERVAYSGVLSNPGDATTTGISFTIEIDPNLELDRSTIFFAPVAIPDTYETGTDTPLLVKASIDPSMFLSANDFDLDKPLPKTNVVPEGTKATSQGGTVDITNRGGFTYTPPSGFTGTDTFTYTLIDRSGATAVGTATVEVGDQFPGVWFVDDDAPSGGNGSMSAPFQDHTQLNGAGGTGDVDEPGHTIFFYEGTYDIGDSFHLEPGQKIVGQGVDLVIGGDVIVSGSPGQRPALTHDTGHKILLADNVELAGFDVGTPTTPVGGIGLNGSAGGLTSLTIDEMTIHTSGGPALHLVDGALDIDLLDVNASHTSGSAFIITGSATGTTSISGTATLAGTTGATLSGNHTVNFTTVNIDASAGTGIAATSNVAVTIGSAAPLAKGAVTNGSVDAIGGPALSFSGGATFSGALTSMSSANSSGNGVLFSTGLHDLTVSGLTAITNSTAQGLFIQSANTASSFTLGATTVNGGTGGLLLDGNGGTSFAFGDTDVSNTSGRGIEIRNASAAYTFGAGSSITNATGNALHVQDGNMTVGFDGSITNTAGKSVYVHNNAATVTIGGTVTDSGTGIQADGSVGDAPITLNGNLDLDTTTNIGLMANDGGTINANGASNAITTTSASAISCVSSTMAGTFHDVDVSAGTANGVHLVGCLGTKTFVDVDVTTTGARGFHAAGGGTVSVIGMSGAQAMSSASTTNARAVNIENTAIGTGGVRFGSVASTGGDHGIRLHTATGTEGFHVTGSGPSDPTVVVGVRGREGIGNGTGGTLAGSTNDHVSLTNVNNVVLRHMVMNTAGDNAIGASGVNGLVLDNTRIDGTADHGIEATSLTGFTMLNSELINAGDSDDENAMMLVNLLGTSNITNSVIDEHYEHGIFASNSTRTSVSTPDRLTVQNTIITDSDPVQGGIGVHYNTVSPTIPIGTALANFHLDVLDSEIRRIRGNGVFVAPQGQTGDKAHVEVRRTTMVGSGASVSPVQIPVAVQVNPNANGSATFVIADNTPGSGGGFSAINAAGLRLKNDSNGSLSGFVTNNTIESNGEAFSVQGDGFGIGPVSGNTVVSMTGNTFTSQNGANGAFISAQDNTGVTTDVTFSNNTLHSLLVGGTGSGLRIDAQDGGNAACVAYTNNTINAPGQFESVGLTPQNGAVINIPGAAGNTPAQITAYIDAQTTEVPPTFGSFAFVVAGGTFGTAACTAPSFAPSEPVVALPSIATQSPAPIALAKPEPAPMPVAETRAPFVAQAAPARRQSVDLGAVRRAVASGPEADDAPEPTVEILESSSSLAPGTIVVFAIHDLPAGTSAAYGFEAAAGQTIKTSTLSTMITASASNATSVMQTANVESHPSRLVTDNTGAGWRNLGIPADGFTVDDLAQFNLVQCLPGYYENQARCDNLPAENLFTAYDGFNLVPASGPAEVLARGTGIYWYLFDEAFDPNEPNPGPSPSQSYELPMTLFATGPVPAGDVSVPLHSNGDRWNLLANPFPQDLDVSGIGGWTVGGTLQTPIGQIWNPNKQTFTLTSQKGNKLAAWQGAFFRNFDALSITYMAAAVVDDAQFIGKAPVAERPQRGLSFELTAETAEGVPTADDAISLAFDAEAHPGLDALDVDKLAPPVPAFALGAFEDEAGMLLAQRSLPHELDRAVAVPLHIIGAGTQGTHVLSWPRIEDVPETWTLRLEDRVTGATVDLREASAYAFESESASASTQALQAPSRGDRGGQTTAAKGSDNGVLPLWRPTVRLPAPAAALSGGASGARFLLIVGPGEPEITAPATGAEAIALSGAFPNPFGSSTTLRYALPSAAHVRLAAYDVLGREVAVLVNAEQGAGTHTATWSPRALASGTYLVRLRVDLPEGASVERSLRVTHNR